jgi:hypothetical protein
MDKQGTLWFGKICGLTVGATLDFVGVPNVFQMLQLEERLCLLKEQTSLDNSRVKKNHTYTKFSWKCLK